MTTHSPDQARAIAQVVAWYQRNAHHGGRPYRLEGPAGSGKTTIVPDITARCAPNHTAYVAPTGKAAAVLRAKGCENATTVHSAIYKPAGERRAAIAVLQAQIAALKPYSRTYVADRAALQRQLDAVTAPVFTVRDHDKAFGGKLPRLIVCDEASMVPDRMMLDLASFGIPILAIGDPYQLPPVGGSARWRSGPPDSLLETIHRGAGRAPLLDLATDLRNGRSAPRWDGVAGATDRTWTAERFVDWDQVIVGRNATRWRMVETIRRVLGRPRAEPVAGDRVMCLRNHPETGAANGQQATVNDAHRAEFGWDLLVTADDGERMVWTVDERGFADQDGQRAAERDRGEHDLMAATFAQAITCHKAQGSQWARVAVVDESRSFKTEARRWLYTAATRSERKCLLLNPRRMVSS